ncbi:MAG: PIN domain-containing protein [Planctomycetes bacterium]|nr:PIN domain-containing protein [Planctomycetota bacterium]
MLIDTGPIVAILSAADQYHQRCTDELAGLRPPLYTCWPVVTEAQWLLRRDARAVEGLFRAFASGLLALLPVDEEAMPWLAAFLRRYSKIEPDLADATLVYLAERERIPTVFTLDQRDFSLYRYSHHRRLKILPSPAP